MPTKARVGAAVVFGSDGKTIVSTALGNLCYWDAATAKLKRSAAGLGEDIYYLAALSRDGATVAFGDFTGRVLLWDVATAKMMLTLPGHSAQVVALRFAPDGKALISIDANGTIKLWELRRLQETAK